jgi:hypothetical protein
MPVGCEVSWKSESTGLQALVKNNRRKCAGIVIRGGGEGELERRGEERKEEE